MTDVTQELVQETAQGADDSAQKPAESSETPADDKASKPDPANGGAVLTDGKPDEQKSESTGDGKDAESDKKTESKDDKSEVPDKYEVEFPEGFEQLDEAALEHFTPVLKDLELSNDKAQKLVNAYAEMKAREAETYNDMVSGWVETAKTDKEIGGDKYEANIATAKRAIAQFGGDGLAEALNLTGAGNHPEIIKAFVKVGKALGEDVAQAQQPAGAPARSRAEILYPSMTQKG